MYCCRFGSSGWVGGFVHVSIVAQGDLMHAGVTGGCELPDMVLGRAGSTLNQ